MSVNLPQSRGDMVRNLLSVMDEGLLFSNRMQDDAFLRDMSGASIVRRIQQGDREIIYLSKFDHLNLPSSAAGQFYYDITLKREQNRVVRVNVRFDPDTTQFIGPDEALNILGSGWTEDKSHHWISGSPPMATHPLGNKHLVKSQTCAHGTSASLIVVFHHTGDMLQLILMVTG